MLEISTVGIFIVVIVFNFLILPRHLKTAFKIVRMQYICCTRARYEINNFDDC